MNETKPVVYQVKNMSELSYILRNIPGLAVTAGCSRIACFQKGERLILPKASVCVRRIGELAQINKTERYIDFGAAVTLSEILKLGRKNISTVLYDAIATIGTPAVRNIGTIGGNIAGGGLKMTAYAPLLALDSKLEIRTQTESELMPLSKYAGVEQNTYISKIRVPVEQWDIAVYRRVGCEHYIDEGTASFVFLAKTQKDILSDIRIAFSGLYVFRNRQFENMLIGSNLPLSPKTYQLVMDEAGRLLPAPPPEALTSSLLRDRFLNLLADSLRTLM